jgi:O-antigen ligase
VRESVREEPRASEGAATFSLVVLVGLAVVSPWAFGSVDSLPRFLLTLTILAACALTLAMRAAARSGGGGFHLPDVPLWPLAALLALGLLQTAPLPATLLRLVAPGSAEVWYPHVGAARAVLGEGARPISIDPEATREGLLLAVGLSGLALAALPALVRPRNILGAAVALTVASAVLAVYGIVARNRFGSLLYGVIPVPTVSPFGPFVSKNHFAGYVGPAALLTLGLVIGLAGRAREREWTRDRAAPGVVLALVAALAMATSLFVSQSRGGVVAAVTGALTLGALVLATRRRSSSLVPVAIVTVALAVALATTLPEDTRARVTTLDGASFRLDTWRDSLRLATRSPALGHGFGSFADAFPRAKRGHGLIRVVHAENEYVELLVEGGVLALGLAVLALLLPARAAFLALARREPLLRGVALGALAGLSALAAHSAFDFNLHIPSNATLAALLAAFAAAGAGLRNVHPGRGGLGAGAILFAAFAVVLTVRGPRAFDRAAVWNGVREEVRAAAASTGPEVRALRAERATARLRAIVSRRPAFAEGWLVLAALAQEEGDAQRGGELAAHARTLDPSRPDLERAAEVIGGRAARSVDRIR